MSGVRAGNLRAELLDMQVPLFGGQIYFEKMEEWEQESKLHRHPHSAPPPLTWLPQPASAANLVMLSHRRYSVYIIHYKAHLI